VSEKVSNVERVRSLMARAVVASQSQKKEEIVGDSSICPRFKSTPQSLFLREMGLPTTVRTGIEHVINGAT